MSTHQRSAPGAPTIHDLPSDLQATIDAERFRVGPDQRILVRGERDAFLASLLPSPYPPGVAPGDRVTAMQMEARERYRARQSFILTAPTSSGKTLAAVAPIFEAGRRAVFCYPFRALLYDQSQELVRIAKAFGYTRDHFGYLFGGVTGRTLAEQISADKPFTVVTPDKLVSLLLGDRTSAMAAAALLGSHDFFFDEIHSYNTMMRRSLIYFERSVCMFQQRQRLVQNPVFIFASATTPVDLIEEFEQGIGIGAADVLTGPSYTGDARVEVLVPRSSRTHGQHPVAEDMAARGHTTNAMVIVPSPFDAWMIANSRVLSGSASLFVGQDKQSEKERRLHLKRFTDSPSEYALVGSNAIGAGVDSAARAIYAQESTGTATVQAVGRGGRGGREADIIYYGHRLYSLAASGLLRSEYGRGDWTRLLLGINPERAPADLSSGLAASPYISYWGEELASHIVSPEDMDLHRQLRAKLPASPDGHLAFRSLTPYTSYESRERIGFSSLFRKRLAMADGRVKGAPNATRYFMTERRAPVRARIQGQHDVAYFGQTTVQRNGRAHRLHHIMARVDFGPFGRHWTVLEVGPAEALGGEGVPDNIHLSYLGRTLAGPGEPMAVRFYH